MSSTRARTAHEAIETALLDHRAVLFDERTGTVHELNASASAVWMLLDGRTDLDGIVAELAALLDTPAERLREDCVATLAAFDRHGLLRDSPEPVEARHRATAAAAPAHRGPRVEGVMRVSARLIVAHRAPILVLSSSDADPSAPEVSPSAVGDESRTRWIDVDESTGEWVGGERRTPFAIVVAAPGAAPGVPDALRALWAATERPTLAWAETLDRLGPNIRRVCDAELDSTVNELAQPAT